MLCQNCNEREANVKYTQIINGEKKEMILCSECSKKLGIDNMNFDMPINFSNFFDDILTDYEEDFLPLMKTNIILKCNNCGMTYEEFLKDGKFGCSNCYNTFSEKIEPILKRIHGNTNYKGRKCNDNKEKLEVNNKNKEKIKTESKTENLQEDLKKAIKEERYEDAAKIRDKIKKEEK